MFRDNYNEVRAAAQAAANLDGCDRGIERDAFSFRFFRLPQRQNRYGYELRCEVVSSEKQCEPGRGPC